MIKLEATPEINSEAWLIETITMALGSGYRVTPIYKKEYGEYKHLSYANGQSYDLSNPEWFNGLNDRLGVILDNVVLIDWDAYKENVLSIAELANKLRISEVELRGAEVQNDPTKDSKHFFFRLPDGFDRTTLKQNNHGYWVKGVDFKVGNQLVYLKPHKQLRNGRLPRLDEIPAVPQIVLTEVLNKPESTVVPGEFKACTTQDEQALKYLNEDCNELSVLTADRNGTLNKMAKKHAQRAYGGMLNLEVVKHKLLAAYLQSGKNQSSFNSTWRSATNAAQKDPVNVIGRSTSIDPNSVGFGKAELPQITEVSVLSTRDQLEKICRGGTYDSISSVAPNIVNIFNANHSVLMHGGKTVVAEKRLDHEGNLAYEFSSVPQRKDFLQNLNFSYLDGDKPKAANCFNVWMKSLDRMTYDGLVFDPSNNTRANFLNLWDGFAVEPVQGEDLLEPILWHFKNILCNGDDGHFRYLLAWLAQIIQEPAQKTGVAVVLKSDTRGTGKNTLSVIMKRILKHHALSIQDGKHLVGSFNNHLANKLFITVEEAFWAGNPKDAGKLKTMVTESTLILEGKGKDAISITSHHRFLMCTNNDWVVPASNTERRWFVLEVSEQKKQDKEYFDRLYDSINNELAIGQLFNMLLNYDLSQFDLRKAPTTDAMQEQVMLSLPSEAAWLMEVLEDGYVADGYVTFELLEAQNVPKRVFRDSYLNYCKQNQIPGYDVKKDSMLGKFIKKTLGLTEGPRLTFPQYGRGITTIQTKSLSEMQTLFNDHYRHS